MVVVASYKDVIIGVFTDVNRAKRAAKQRFPHAFNKVRYTPFTIDDKETDDKDISKGSAGAAIRYSKSELKRRAVQSGGRSEAASPVWIRADGDWIGDGQ